MRRVVSLELGKLLGVLLDGGDEQRLFVVLFVLFLGQVGRLESSLEHGRPVEVAEPLVLLDVGHAVLQIADAFGQVDLEQILDEVFEVHAEVRRKAQMARHDLLVDLDWIVGEEWRIASYWFTKIQAYIHK